MFLKRSPKAIPRVLATLALSILLTGAAVFPRQTLAAAADSCQAVFFRVIQPESEIQKLNILSYNVENLFVSVGKHERKDVTTFEPVPGKDSRAKPDHEVEIIRQIIKESEADVVVLVEVEGRSALESLATNYLEGKYDPYLTAGNDSRGIEIGFLVRRDLPWDITMRSNRELEWRDVVNERKGPLFARDLPVLEFRRSQSDADPLFVIIGNHAKSQRDITGDPQSFRWRSAQFMTAKAVVDEYRQKNIPVLFAGDFNTDVRSAPEVQPLKEVLSSAFDHAREAPAKEDRITHSYHPHGRETVYTQLDDIMVSSDIRHAVEKATIIRYRDERGQVRPLPRNIDERNLQPSDHFPVLMTIKTDPILRPSAGKQ